MVFKEILRWLISEKKKGKKGSGETKRKLKESEKHREKLKKDVQASEK